MYQVNDKVVAVIVGRITAVEKSRHDAMCRYRVESEVLNSGYAFNVEETSIVPVEIKPVEPKG